MAMIMDSVQAKRGQLLSVEDASKLLGISDQCVRLAIRMRLIHAERVGRTYAIRSEQLALVSERYHNNFYVDFPTGKRGTLNRVVLE